ncbi:hypothetical protein OFC62_27045, partial [Escherichia coli]|nr:hypothetical protein [Escherichia coli]
SVMGLLEGTFGFEGLTATTFGQFIAFIGSPTIALSIATLLSVYTLGNNLTKEEANEKIQEILDALGWEDEYFKISAINRSGTKELCYKLADFMENLPREEEEVAEEDKVNFMWDDYHKDAMAGKDVVTEDDD